tara:strand:- start:745 stop:1581 length:837 start_codon:yes stop_codon:yes gene_type:complete
MLESFEANNEYPNFEWVFVDLGSTDGTQEFLFDKYKSTKHASLVLGNENKYKEILKNKDLHARKKTHQTTAVQIFGWVKNIARSVGKGDYFIEIADDHRFIKKGDWVSDMLDVFQHRKKKNDGACDISSIIYRALPFWRLHKPNNTRSPEQITDSGVSYFLSDIKGYDDYHMMKRSTYDEIGPYLEVDKIKDEEKLSQWKNGTSNFCQMTDYIQRCNKAGYQKAFLKIPFAIDCEYSNSNESNKITFANGELEKTFKSLNRPISTEEINNFQTLTHNG